VINIQLYKQTKFICHHFTLISILFCINYKTSHLLTYINKYDDDDTMLSN